MAWIEMRHPTLPDSEFIRVPEQVVIGHEIAGWVVVTDAPDDITVSDTDLTPAEPDSNIPAEPDAPAE